jgi:hypothetical protein
MTPATGALPAKHEVGRVSPSAPPVTEGRGEKEQRGKGEKRNPSPFLPFPFSPLPSLSGGALGETRPTAFC